MVAAPSQGDSGAGLIAVRYEPSDPPQIDFKIVLAEQALGDQLRHQQAQVIAEVLQWLMTNHPSRSAHSARDLAARTLGV